MIDAPITEEREQITLFNWADMMIGKYPELRLMHHIPNGGKRSKTEAARFKAQGVKPGVPDICLPVPKGGFHGMYIELKRTGGKGKLSSYQKEWLQDLAMMGYKAVCCFGWEEAAREIEEYLNYG